MNFSPFGSHFPTSLPIHQFAAKFGHENTTGTTLCPPQDVAANRYTNNGVPTFTQHHPPQQQHIKYQSTPYMNQNTNYTHQTNLRPDKRQGYDQQELAQELCAVMLQQPQNHHQEKQQHEKNPKERQDEQCQQQQIPQQPQANQDQNVSSPSGMPSAWQSLATPGSTVADYLSHLPASTLPLSLHHFLKYSTETIKKETNNLQGNETHLNLVNVNGNMNNNAITTNLASNLATIPSAGNNQGQAASKKKKKKRSDKEKKPRPKPGEIRLTTALDGSTLYCCPECHMAYPEKELLEQHLVGHTLERRFVCDICGAGLKRKDHLTRHKQSHNPERPYVCTVCLKAFKRKEQLTLHFVIHSGEKRHVCTECGKGFYRKDHLRKHTRSHIARRVKAELSQQSTSALQIQVANHSGNNTLTQSIIS